MGIIYFRVSAHLLHLKSFRIICSSLLVEGKITKCTWAENEVYGGNVEVITISEIYGAC
jgi:hypothetical protein